MRIAIRTSGGKKIGLGHLFRCLSLAHALKITRKSVEVLFIANKESQDLILKNGFNFISSEYFNKADLELIKSIEPTIIIFDSYLASKEYLEDLKSISFIVQFDDNNDIYGPIVADILINGNLHSNSLDYTSKYDDTLFLLGPKYLVMKPEYWNLSNHKEDGEGILITTGGGDLYDLMPKLFDALKPLKTRKRFVISPAFSNTQEEILSYAIKDDPFSEIIRRPSSLKSYIADSEVVISASGSTVYEILTLRKIPIVFTIAQNQLLLAHKLRQEGIPYLGWHNQIDWKNLSSTVQKVLNNKAYFRKKFKKLFEQFDGKGALRVADIILKKVNR